MKQTTEEWKEHVEQIICDSTDYQDTWDGGEFHMDGTDPIELRDNILTFISGLLLQQQTNASLQHCLEVHNNDIS